MSQGLLIPFGTTGVPNSQEARDDNPPSIKLDAISSFKFNKINDTIDVDFCNLNLTLKSNGKKKNFSSFVMW